VKSRLSINFEYAALRTVCALANVMPYVVMAAFARALGWSLVSIFRFKRKRTFARIRSVFPEMSEREVRAVAIGSLQNILLNAVEMIRAPHLDRAWMDAHVEDGPRYKKVLQDIVNEGHGAVIMVSHSGNWYMAAWAMAKYGLPLFAIAARQRNPKIDAWMNRQYGDIEVLDRDCRDTLVKIHRYLKEGRAFAILPDLRVRRKDVEVDFLRGKANVSHAGAMFAVRSGCPIVVATMSRRNGRHVFNYLDTLRPDPSAADLHLESERLTREAMRLLDEAVQKRPQEWFWYNKRWILEPPTEV